MYLGEIDLHFTQSHISELDRYHMTFVIFHTFSQNAKYRLKNVLVKKSKKKAFCFSVLCSQGIKAWKYERT